MKLTKVEAKRLSILKWKYIVENDGSQFGLTAKCPELYGVVNRCGYCEKYIKGGCSKCPLFIGGIMCDDSRHVYNIWVKHPTKKTAQAVLDLIKST